MNKRILTYILLLTIGLFVANNSYAQKLDRPQSLKNRRKHLQKKEEQRKAEEAIAVKELKKLHMSLQTKKVKKRMKKAKKKAKRNNANKKGNIFTRWLHKLKK